MSMKMNIGTTLPEPPYCNEAGMKRLAELERIVRLLANADCDIERAYIALLARGVINADKATV